MTYQFLHIETYSRKPTRAGSNNNHFNSTEQVFGEAMRDPKYIMHIDNPCPPHVLMYPGAIHPSELKAIHDAQVSTIEVDVVSALGRAYVRRLKTDAKTLYTEIHSHPAKPSDLKATVGLEKELGNWLNLVIKDFKQRMPSDIAFSVVVHMDESHVHCHILAINISDPKLDANKLHAGKAAAAKYRQEHSQNQSTSSAPPPPLKPSVPKPRKPRQSRNPQTQSKNEQLYARKIAEWHKARQANKRFNELSMTEWRQSSREQVKPQSKERPVDYGDKQAYTQALIDLQDHYYEAVGKYCGLLRTGPKVLRLTTKEANARKADAERLASSLLDLESRSKSIDKKEQRIAVAEANLTRREYELDQQTHQNLKTTEELRIAHDAIADAIRQLTQDNVLLSNVVLHDYVYAAYETPEILRTQTQNEVTRLVDQLICATQREGKSTVDEPMNTNRIG